MSIRTKNWLAMLAALCAIGLTAAAIGWSAMEVADASRQRRQATEILQRYTQLRLVTFDYLQSRSERARAQWEAVSRRLDATIAANHFREPAHAVILAGLRARRAAGRQLFAELTAARERDFADAASRQRFEAQLGSQLRIDQQDSLFEVIALIALVNQRIEAAQGRALVVIAAGLGLLALIVTGLSWLIHRHVLAPVIRLQRVTQAVAAGNLNLQLGLGGDDEIAALSRDFDAMMHALRESFARIERGNRDLTVLNQELEAFGYSVSHDLRAPLRSMDGFSQILLEDYGDKLDADGVDALQRIRGASQSMGGLIDDLLALSRVTRVELNLTRVDLSAMAHEIASALEREEPSHAPRWEIEDGLVLQADRSSLRIALRNLMHNAFKFSGKTPNAVVRVGALEREGHTVVFVADNGAGFDMAHAEHLFGAFQRLHSVSEFPGTGIGLAIVQRVIHRHHGKVWAQAQPGLGATFFFHLGP